MKHNEFLLLASKQGRTIQYQSRDWYDWCPKEQEPDLTSGVWRVKPGLAAGQAAALLSAHSEGKKLQFLAPENADWLIWPYTDAPSLGHTQWLWRVKPAERISQEEKDAMRAAFQAGKTIQLKSPYSGDWSDWTVSTCPEFTDAHTLYRIKPEPTKEITMDPTPHKYAAAIHAWADGKPIQYRSKMCHNWTDYTSLGSPAFASPELEWRPKNKWQHVIDAFRQSKAIQYKAGGAWYDSMMNSPQSNPQYEWRIRPRIQWTRIYLDKTGEPQLAWTEEKSDLNDSPDGLACFDRWLDDEWREHELEG